MKRTCLSLILAALFALSLAPAALAAQTETPSVYDGFTDRDTIEYTQAVASLAALGVVGGQEDGAFHPQDQVTRAEMAKLIALTLSGGKEVSGGKAGFPDVAGTWSEPYVAYCVEQGVIDGRTDGNFHPDDPVTGYEASKMLLCALGYDAQAEGLTGREWSLRTAMLGVTVSLFNGLSNVGNLPVTRQGACFLLVNALQCKEVTYQDGTAVDGALMLTARFGYCVVEGTVEKAGEHLTIRDARVNNVDTDSADGTYAAAVDPDGLLSEQVEFFAKFADPEHPVPDGAEILPGSLVSIDQHGCQLVVPAGM